MGIPARPLSAEQDSISNAIYQTTERILQQNRHRAGELRCRYARGNLTRPGASGGWRRQPKWTDTVEKGARGGGAVRTREERIPQSPPSATTILQLLEIRTRIYLMTHHQHQVRLFDSIDPNPTWRRGWQSITHCGGPSSRQCRQHKEMSLAMKLRLPRRSRQQRLALSQFLPLVVRHE